MDLCTDVYILVYIVTMYFESMDPNSREFQTGQKAPGTSTVTVYTPDR